MTLKTSFFNKGIYKSTVKRYAWGSILYFIILFMATGLSVFLNIGKEYIYYPTTNYSDNPLILGNSYMAFPILMAIVVPSIVALMVFRFIHSKKQAIFIHSIPVSRKANFISSILAAFTLMLVPVIANGIILIFISLGGYGKYFTVAHCFAWMGYNAFGIFLMFSCAVFAASITGNSFAMLAINVLIHVFLFVIISTLSIMAEVFVYGFTQANDVYEIIAENNFAYVVFGFIDKYFRRGIVALDYIKFSAAALALYIASYFLYKNRKIESASDVAGFKCLNIIFKYIVTFGVTMFGFAVFSEYIGENTAVFWVIIAIISIIAYAASEMVLKKTLNVLYSWKGFAGFAVVFTALTLIFSHTSFFGYETSIPEKSEISEATIYNYYYCETEPFSANEQIIKLIADTHDDFITNNKIPTLNPMDYYGPKDTRLHIKYKLKNGKSLERVYNLKVDKCLEIMNKFYEIEEYKKLSEQVFMDDSRITRIFVNNSDNPVKDYSVLLSALRKDYMSMSYDEIYHYENNPDKYINEAPLYNVRIEYTFERHSGDESYTGIDGYYINVTGKFKNTVKWLEENGYGKLN